MRFTTFVPSCASMPFRVYCIRDRHIYISNLISFYLEEAKQAHFQAPRPLPKCYLPRQLPKHRVDLHSPDHRLRVTGTIPSLGPFPLPVEETTPTKKQKTAPQRVAAPTPKEVTKKPEARDNPTKPQPAKRQVCPKTWSPRSSPKQRRSRTSTKPEYLAPLKKNRFYPLAYIKGEKPTLHRTTKPTQQKLACSYKPKIKSCITRPRQEFVRACCPATRPFISIGAELANLKLRCDRLRTASRSCPCQSSRKTSSVAAHERPHSSFPEHSLS
ncbi:hypothetical protein AAC387_Pa10g0569 [Persea americana]